MFLSSSGHRIGWRLPPAPLPGGTLHRPTLTGYHLPPIFTARVVARTPTPYTDQRGAGVQRRASHEVRWSPV